MDIGTIVLGIIILVFIALIIYNLREGMGIVKSIFDAAAGVFGLFVFVGIIILVVSTAYSCITHKNAPPDAVMTIFPGNVSIGKPVHFDASGSEDLDGKIVSYQWQFGDGTTGSGEDTYYAYPKAGKYDILLTLTDSGGAVANVTKTLNVLEKPAARIKLIVNANSWLDQANSNYTIYEFLDNKLEDLNYIFVDKNSSDYDVILQVDYNDRQGNGYKVDLSVLSDLSTSTYYGTKINCGIKILGKNNNYLFSDNLYAESNESIMSSNGVENRTLYNNAVKNLLANDKMTNIGAIMENVVKNK